MPRIRYGLKQAAGDFSGGLIAALIALPYGLAMASLMGLPPVLGLFTSLLTAPITAFLGRNPVLIGGTSSVTVPFIAVAVKQQGIGGAAKVTLVAGVFMMIFCTLRLGRHIARVPHAVVSGFSCGIGGMMVITQLRTIFGLERGAAGASMMSELADVLSLLGSARWEPFLLAAVVIAISVFLAARFPKVPAPLIGVLTAVALMQFLRMHEREVGVLSLDLPPFAGFSWHPKDVFEVLPAGFALAFVASVNILLTSRVVEHFRSRHKALKKMDADAELGAYGIANVAAGIFAAPLSVGIPARSLANVRCGGTTRASNLFHAAVLAAVIGLGSGLLSHIPLAALAGVTAWMGFCLLDWSTWRRIPLMRPVDAAAFLATALGVLFINAVAAVGLGCLFYGVEFLFRRLFSPSPAIARLQPESQK